MAFTKKVLLLCETGGPGGAERVVAELAKSYQRSQIPVAAATFRSGWLTEELDRLGIERVLIESSKGLDPLLPFRILRAIKKTKAQVLHSHLLDANFYGALAARLARIPHIATEHGDVHHTDGKKHLALKIKTISRCGSNFTAVSQFSADRLVELGARRDRTSVVRNPSDITEALSRVQKLREPVRSSLSVKPDEWVWIHVANLRPVKDQETLIRGFAQAVHQHPAQRLLIVGDGPERSRLEALADQLEVRRKVIFGGFQQDVPRFLAASDGFILSSKSEAMPMSLLEAAQARLVLVGSAVGGIPECLAEGRGYLFPAGKPEALAECLLGVIRNPEAAKQSAAAAFKWARSECSHLAITSKFVELYSL